ncbi:MAG: prepilin-type N-terminal cleavage/methylation domain-containing protein [Planctomycetota bacterium]
MHRRNSRGFTLIEMVVVVAIIAAMAAILVPIVADELASSESSKALGDTQRIAAAITQYVKDTRHFPTGPLGNNTVEFLVSDGTVPSPNTFDSGGTKGDLVDYLTNGATNGGSLYKGPYMQEIAADPWGNAYVVNVNGYYSGTENVWVLSAGPNGDLETAVGAAKPAGDDIGVLIE